MRAAACVLLLAASVARAEPSAAQREFEAATAREATGDYAGAAQALEALAANYPTDPFAADALFEAAVLAEERLHDPAHALTLYQRILRDYARSRLERRARARVDFLSSSLRTGEAPLREYQDVLANFSTRPPAESIARMERLLAAHPDFALADRALYWLAGTLAAQHRDADALARWDELTRRFPSSEWTGRGQKARGDFLLARGHPYAARAVFEALRAHPTDALARAAADEGLRNVHTALTRLAEALVAGAYLLAFVVAHVWWLVRRKRLARVPIEALYYAPVALVFVLAAATENRAIAWATFAIAAGGGVVVWLSGAASAARERERESEGAGAMRGRERFARAAAAAVAVAAVMLLAVHATGLTDLVIETIQSGPER
jgi:TolA-binding protein